jgi:hypothetical protein
MVGGIFNIPVGTAGLSGVLSIWRQRSVAKHAQPALMLAAQRRDPSFVTLELQVLRSDTTGGCWERGVFFPSQDKPELCYLRNRGASLRIKAFVQKQHLFLSKLRTSIR